LGGAEQVKRAVEAELRSRRNYLPLRFLLAGRFLIAALRDGFAAFLGDFLAGLAADFFEDVGRLPPKMFSQLSEYCLVAPMRTTLMV
jgi:hypothetical protein